MKTAYVIILLFFLFSVKLSAQKVTVSGTVKEKGTGEVLIGANVFDKAMGKGAVANQFGFYSYSTAADDVELYFSYVGYQPQRISFKVTKDTTIHVSLVPDGELEEVVVTAQDMEQIQDVSRMSTINLPIQHIKDLPALLGEADVLRTLQLLPGVQSGTEAGSGLFVRGGGPDQNLMLLDGVPIYNASHTFGLFSVFNTDALNNVEMIKGGFPARYGGRLSSVVDVSMKDGNMEKVEGEGSIGLLSSKITVGGPIRKGKTSFIVSARRTYFDLLAKPFIASEDSKWGYYFYDLNGKVNHIIDDKNRLYLSLYKGQDKFFMKNDEEFFGNTKISDKDESAVKWGNFIAALRWNHLITSRLFSNFTFTHSIYKLGSFNRSEGEEGAYSVHYSSGIKDWAAKADFEFIPNPSHYIRFGSNMIFHKFSPGLYETTISSATGTGPQHVVLGNKKQNSVEYAVYAEDDIELTSRLKTNLGLHYSGFLVGNEHYKSLQPRVSTRYLLDKNTSVKASFATMTQYVHLLSNGSLALPTDIWVPVTERIGPQKAAQVALGAAKNFKGFELTAEVYYKTMNGLIEYKDGARYFNMIGEWQDDVVVGIGRSTGFELLAKREIGKLSGWASYTLSNTERKFDEIDNGRWFPYKYDRRHDISIALTYKISDNKELSLGWVYGTGYAISLPTQRYEGIEPHPNYHHRELEVQYYEGRNSFRQKDYHRLDLSFSWKKKKRWGERKWMVGVYNAYNRKNPFYTTQQSGNNKSRKFVQHSLLGILPSVSYVFKF